MKALKKIDKKLYEVVKRYNFNRRIIPEASSRKIEKCRFMNAVEKGEKYNPVFNYHKEKDDLKKMILALDKLKFTDDFIGGILREKAFEIRIKAEFASKDENTNDELTEYSEILFGKPDKTIISDAKNALNIEIKNVDPEKKISLDQLYYKIEQELGSYRIEGWKIETVGNVAYSVSILPIEKKIRINREVVYTEKSSKRMIVHEIGTHVLRAKNGMKQPYWLCQSGFPYYSFTEEGTALLNEYRHGLLDENRLRDHAGRIMAIHFALQGSFYDTFISLLEYGFTKEHAYTMTFRARCGLLNQSHPGAYTRDWIYFGGFKKLKDLVDSNQIEFNDLLKYGKTSYQHLNQYIEFVESC